jgi:hypothetical protein
VHYSGWKVAWIGDGHINWINSKGDGGYNPSKGSVKQIGRLMTNFKPQILNGVPIPYDATVAELQSAIEEAGPKAWAGIYALAQKPEAAALAVLIQLTRSSDPHLRRSAVEAIGIYPLGQTASEVVCHLLQDRDGFVIRAAAMAAANLKLKLGHEQIINLVNASEDSTRVAALSALEALWEQSDFEAVFDRYLRDPSDSVRKQAAYTLRKNVGAKHREQLFSAWSKDRLPRHRVRACEIAATFGNRTLISCLELLKSDLNGHVRLAAERALELVNRK